MTTCKSGGEHYSLDHNRARSVGRGSFGEVFIGRTESGREVAVKLATTPKSIESSYKEIKFLQQFFGEPNIVQLIGFQHQKDETGKTPQILTFAMELAECSLDKLMREGANIRGLPQDVLIDFIADCCSAMKSLRAKNVAHRDIKHMNILVFRCKQKTRKSTYLFKFCDLGNANLMDDAMGMNSLVGTANVLHPVLAHELTKGSQRKWVVEERYTGDQADFWSLACTLHFAACGHYPFPHSAVNNYNLYYDCVSNLPKDCVAASYVQGSYPYRFQYKKMISNTKYPLWFRHAFSCLLRVLLHNPSLEAYEKMASALISCQEYTFLSITQLDVVKYADVSNEELFSQGYPTVKEAIGLDKDIVCRLVGVEEETPLLNQKNLSKLSTKSPYMVYPWVKEIVVPPKTWETMAKSEILHNCDRPLDAFEVRASYLGKGFVALHETDKMCTLFEATKNIITQQLGKLRMRVVAEKDSAAYPLRFATYANCQCQAWLVSDVSERTISMQGLDNANTATTNLSRVISQMDGMVKQLDAMLGEVEQLQLDEHELPGMEAELSRYSYCDRLNENSYPDDVKKSTMYTQQLVQKCFERRTAVADEFCGTTGEEGEQKKPLRDTLLQAASRLFFFSSELDKLKGYVEEYMILIERPFQEMKTRVESMKVSMNLTDKAMKKSMAYHNRPVKVSKSSQEIHDMAKKINDMVMRLK